MTLSFALFPRCLFKHTVHDGNRLERRIKQTQELAEESLTFDLRPPNPKTKPVPAAASQSHL